ncbi:hypothetical protein [Pseudomonas citronellolis]|uniref:hypothetical protein n=1 Tax=Pseudomonas citronellolis TaxID=53408 RepID=UPI0023E431DD|nr:hypothetical protein [Pseudomonas citronellolis]MDF3932968.1 hypothetical protein [Pseudomonas citronellolis]
MTSAAPRVPISAAHLAQLGDQEVRVLAEEAMAKLFRQDQKIYQLQVDQNRLNQLLVKLLDLFIADNFSKLHSEMRYLAENLQELRAAKAAAKRVH